MEGCTLKDDGLPCHCAMQAVRPPACAYAYSAPERPLTEAEHAVLNDAYSGNRRRYAELVYGGDD